MLIKRPFLSALLLPVLAIGCGRGAANLDDGGSEVQSADLNTLKPDLGRAYSAWSDDFLGHTCLDLSQLTESDYVREAPNEGELTYKQDLSSDQVRSILKGDAKAKLKMSNFALDGYLEIENVATSDSLSATVNVIYYAEAGRYRIKDAAQTKIKLNEYGTAVATDGSISKDERAKRCGTSYLKGFELTAAFVATLRFEFSSESEKERLKGKMDLVMKKLEAGGTLEVDDFNVQNSGSVELKVKQLGGDVTKLGAVLNEHITHCSATNPVACVKAMDGVRRYVAEDFPKQFTYRGANGQVNDRDINPLSYWIRNPEFAPISTVYPTWDGKVPSPEQLLAYEKHRVTMNDKFLDELRDFNRVRAILASGIVKSLDHRNKLIATQETINERIEAIADAIAECYKIADDYTRCAAAVDELKATLPTYPIDYSLMVILPTSFEDYCGQMKVWHRVYFGEGAVAGNPNAAEQDMVADIRTTLSAILNIKPIRDLQGDVSFDATLKSDVVANNKTTIWTPAGNTNLGDGTPYWNCPRLGEKIKGLDTDHVKLADMKLHNIEPLATFEDLESLDISNNKIKTGMAAIGKLEYLEVLKADNSKIKALKGIRNNALKKLDLSDNLIASEELQYLADMRALQNLDLDGNDAIVDLDGLAKLPALQAINVERTQIKKAAMERFLTQVYANLGGSSPEIFWDTTACPQVKASGIDNSDKLVCN